MLYRRLLDAERRHGAPVGAEVLAVAKAGSVGHARRWALAADEAGLEQRARDAVRAAASLRRSGRRDDARAERCQHALCFYRTHALRCRDAARRLIS